MLGGFLFVCSLIILYFPGKVEGNVGGGVTWAGRCFHRERVVQGIDWCTQA